MTERQNAVPLTDQHAEALIEEKQRLEKLSDLELIAETISHEVADDERVLQLMQRLYPDWQNEPDLPSLPARARWVSVAVPVDVAHDVVAFSECHCEESVAKGEDEPNGELYKPCLWCACQAALYRNTRLEMYKPDAHV